MTEHNYKSYSSLANSKNSEQTYMLMWSNSRKRDNYTNQLRQVVIAWIIEQIKNMTNVTKKNNFIHRWEEIINNQHYSIQHASF